MIAIETPLDAAAWQLVDAHECGELTEQFVDDVAAALLRRRSRQVLKLEPLPERVEALPPELVAPYWRAVFAAIDFGLAAEALELGQRRAGAKAWLEESEEATAA